MRKIAAAPFAFLIAVLFGAQSWAADSTSRVDNIAQLIQQVRSEADPLARERAATTLAFALQRMNRSSIDGRSIDPIVDLLNDDSDAVRLRIASAIAAIGPPARRAAPALENALELARQHILLMQHRNFVANGLDFYRGTATSADSVCFALKEIGAPSPPDCFDGHFGEPVIEVPWTK